MLRISKIYEEQLQEGELLHEGRASSGNMLIAYFEMFSFRNKFFRRLTNVNFYETRVGRPRGRRLVVHKRQIEIQLGR